MSDLPNEVARFFENLADDDEGAETLAKQLAPRRFVFELDEGKPFVLDASLEDVSCEWGTIESPDLVNDVTRVETDTDTLYAMMRGQVSPLDALNDGDLFMSSMMTARCYNYGLLRAFRRGGEMTSRAQTTLQT
jgi:hypothetical protein